MDTITQTLESQILWQTPVKLIVTVAFYAFAAKLLAVIVRRALLATIGTRKWFKGYGVYDIAPYMPGNTKIGIWLDKKADDKYEKDRDAGNISEGARRRNLWSLLFGGLTIAHVWLVKENEE
ncbi:MAG: hypothetical protein OXH29_04140 [bacterium]|nr:hypothetical protein [bacterium]